ncbi:unnamed protein product, partial [marine sediment metagenome]
MKLLIMIIQHRPKIGATHDTMDPEHMEWVASQIKHGQFLLCP